MESIRSIKLKKKIARAVNEFSLSKDQEDYDDKYDSIEEACKNYLKEFPEDINFISEVEDKINKAESKFKFMETYNEDESKEFENWEFNKTNSISHENSNKEEVNVEDSSNKIQEAIDLLKDHYGDNIKIEIKEWVKQ